MDNNMKSGQENILPDAAGLFFALRSMGYKNTAAMADLIDNSIDAQATNVWVSIENDLSKIFIADNGTGMSAETLRTAIRLGGKKVHDNGSDLGKYGLGLITASISMGRVVRIITKYDGIYNTAVLDYDVIRETNLFKADFYDSTEAEVASFNFRTKNADSGTVLIIDKCDKLQYTKAKDLISAVDESVSEVFRVYLNEGNSIEINGSRVIAYDPLLLNLRGSRRLVDETINVKSSAGATGKIHVLAVMVPDQGAATNRKLHLNITGQGFYILRNNREIASALEFQDIFKKHNDFNLLRIELSFSPELDDLMGINLKKHDIAPAQEVINALKAVLDAPIKKAREEMKAKQRNKDAKNPFLQAPKPAPAPASEQPSNVSNSMMQTTIEEKTAPSFVATAPLAMPAAPETYEVTFSTYAGAENDPLLKFTESNGVITIRYNICNEYYSAKILSGDSSIKAKETLDAVLKASILAYLKTAGAASLASFVDAIAATLTEAE